MKTSVVDYHHVVDRIDRDGSHSEPRKQKNLQLSLSCFLYFKNKLESG